MLGQLTLGDKDKLQQRGGPDGAAAGHLSAEEEKQEDEEMLGEYDNEVI
jgi:hypothetical protein